jgi:mono/diheme cytochrome c family protein
MSINGLALLSLVVLAAPRPTEAAMPIAMQPASVHADTSNVHRIDNAGNPVNGRRLFLENNCYICHGGRGGGGMCPSLRDNRPDASDVADAVLNGEPQGMPSFARLLTDADVADIAAYINSLRSANEPTFVEWWLPLPK